ncbi:MAG: Crp/Fnr family transcriptional regulator [Spirochaetaceae bacterium]|nr:Crp/Fnr family transcriptional regulator [Spirochaetaceae bacterium]
MAKAGPFERFVKTYRSGEIIFSEFESGDAFYVITSGRVELVRLFGNVEKILDILVSNDMFGEMAILENSPRSATAIALDEVTVLEFNRDSFDLLMRGNPPVALRLLKMFAKRLYDAKRRYRTLALKEPQARVASVFVMLDEARPAPPGGSASREFPVTALDIARWAALSPAEAEKALDRFVSQRRIEIRGDTIVVKNTGFFCRLARHGGVRRKIPEKAAVFL